MSDKIVAFAFSLDTKFLQDCSREELMEVIQYLAEHLERERLSHKRTFEYLSPESGGSR